MSKDRRKGPLAALKVGDEVAWQREDKRWEFTRVAGVSPTGQMTTADGKSWLADGRQRGGAVGYRVAPTLEPMTEDLRRRAVAVNASKDRAEEIRATAREIYRVTSGSLRMSVVTAETSDLLKRALAALKGE